MSGRPQPGTTEGPPAPLSLKDLPQDSPIMLTVLARRMNLRTRRLKYRLLKVHKKHEEPVLVRIGNHWAVASINRLRQVWHGLGERGLTVEELTEQLAESREREERARDRAREAEKQIQSLRARQRATEDRMVKLEDSFEKATRIFAHWTDTDLTGKPTPLTFRAEENEDAAAPEVNDEADVAKE